MSIDLDYSNITNLSNGMLANFTLIYEDNCDYDVRIFIKCFTRQILRIIKNENMLIDIKNNDDLKKYFKFERNTNYLDFMGYFNYDDLQITMSVNGRLENIYSKKCAICIIKITGENHNLYNKLKPVGKYIEKHMLEYIEKLNKQRRDWFDEIDYYV